MRGKDADVSGFTNISREMSSPEREPSYGKLPSQVRQITGRGSSPLIKSWVIEELMAMRNNPLAALKTT